MTRNLRRILCHDCSAVLTADDRAHYVYQCHGCVMVEHDLLLLSAREPDHPDLDRLRSAVDIRPTAPRRRAA